MRINISIILLFILFNTIYPIALELVYQDLNKPIHICHDNAQNNKLYIVEQRGKIIELNEIREKSIFLDITDRVKGPGFFGDERGLLGLAFHPDYKNNGYFFINYIDNDGNTKISKCFFENNIFNEIVLLEIKQPYQNHNGGHLEFGPDGYLYIATGDGGSSGDPENNAQNLSSLLGKILRIDVNEKLYKVPKDNPFLNQTNAKPEIWAYGLRNPWKFSFSMIDNTMFIADVGQNSWEELNVQDFRLAGLNYGWNLKEGKSIFKKNSLENLTDPLIQYSSNASYGKTLAGLRQTINAVGCSITGGYSYHGEINHIKEQYFFGDYCTGKIWSIKNYTSPNFEIIDWTQELIGNKKQLYISSFGRDFYGELYLADHSGSIYKIVK